MSSPIYLIARLQLRGQGGCAKHNVATTFDLIINTIRSDRDIKNIYLVGSRTACRELFP